MIRFKNLSYKYQNDDKKNLDRINFQIKKGEFILITGRSGCGKTTLSKCINGLIPYFHEGFLEGDVWVNGKNISGLQLHEIGEKVASVFQDPRSQFFTTNTTDEVAFGCQNMGMSREQILERINKAFNILMIDDLKDKSIFELSSGEKQKIAIASCYAMNPDVYLLDEPSANLDIKSIDNLVNILKKIKNGENTIIVMEHRLYYLKGLADRVIYMDNGKISHIFGSDDINELSSEKLDDMGLRHFDLDEVQYCGCKVQNTKKVKLKVENLEFAYSNRRRRIKNPKVIEDLSFTSSGGEIIGITGENGAGKTTLAKVLAGLLKEDEGNIQFNDKQSNEKDRLKNSYFVMQDSDYQLFSDSVVNELKLGNEYLDDIEGNINEVMEYLNLGEYRENHPASLSRGQKQRLTIGLGIISEAPINFFDEPTSGLDWENMKNVVKLLEGLALKGRLVFVISHDYEFLLNICSRILYLNHGKIEEDFKLDEKTVGKLRDLLFADNSFNQFNGENNDNS